MTKTDASRSSLIRRSCTSVQAPWCESTVDRRGNDQAKPDGHSANNDGQRDVFFLHQFIPEIVGREPVDDEEAETEHNQAEDRIDEGVSRRIQFIGYLC